VNLLVVDWDYFIPIGMHNPDGSLSQHWMLYDWGHRESALFIEALWPARAAGFMRLNLPLPTTTGEEKDFWKRFSFSRKATVGYADSNAWAASPMVTGLGRRARQWKNVWLYDAHHDAGYNGADSLKALKEGRWSCEDWMILYWALGASLHVRYPKWRAYVLSKREESPEPVPPIPVERLIDAPENRPYTTVFDRVFVCRSGAWTPPWCDDAFSKFLLDCPARGGQFCLDKMQMRPWSEAQVERVEHVRRALEAVEKHNEKIANKETTQS
jgi:hypothetical protein